MLAALGTDASHLKPVRALKDGDVTVVSPIEDTSAAKAGLLANDLITRLDAEESAD
jgi:C-terminal processing protease CtpA/Prc